MSPTPKPAKMLPMKKKIDVEIKKNPTPIPIIKPPPDAQVLRSSFLSAISNLQI